MRFNIKIKDVPFLDAVRHLLRHGKWRRHVDAADKPVAQAPLPAWSGSARTGTDLDLAPIMRTEANYWKAQFFQASRELTKANKGIRRLRSGRDRELERLRLAIYRYHGNDCMCQDCAWVKAQNNKTIKR